MTQEERDTLQEAMCVLMNLNEVELQDNLMALLSEHSCTECGEHLEEQDEGFPGLCRECADIEMAA